MGLSLLGTVEADGGNSNSDQVVATHGQRRLWAVRQPASHSTTFQTTLLNINDFSVLFGSVLVF